MTIANEDAALHTALGANLRVARKAAGKTQQDVLPALGITLSQLSRYETGENVITPARMVRLANLYGVTVGRFFNGLKVGTGGKP
jgi:transcriptional regulator with XRE-family HTH domain